jgi:hypothetical protein
MSPHLNRPGQRTWTDVGAPTVQAIGRDRLEQAIAALTWHYPGPVTQMNVLDKTAIKTLIHGFQLHSVTQIAAGVSLDSLASTEDSYGLVGVENNYANGLARIYAIDLGADAVVVASDFWPRDTGTAETAGSNPTSTGGTGPDDREPTPPEAVDHIEEGF